MSGKSQHAKGKHSSRSKRRKSSRRLDLEGRHSLATAAQRQPVAQTHEPAPRPSVSAPSATVSTPMAKPSAVWHPYVAIELRRIGILAGIMLAILVVLALVLS